MNLEEPAFTSRTKSESATSGSQADQQMQMVGHIVYGNQLLPLRGDDAGDVFLQFVIVFRRDEILPAFHRKHDVKINLCVGIGHAWNISLLTE